MIEDKRTGAGVSPKALDTWNGKLPDQFGLDARGMHLVRVFFTGGQYMQPEFGVKVTLVKKTLNSGKQALWLLRNCRRLKSCCPLRLCLFSQVCVQFQTVKKMLI